MYALCRFGELHTAETDQRFAQTAYILWSCKRRKSNFQNCWQPILLFQTSHSRFLSRKDDWEANCGSSAKIVHTPSVSLDCSYSVCQAVHFMLALGEWCDDTCYQTTSTYWQTDKQTTTTVIMVRTYFHSFSHHPLKSPPCRVLNNMV